MSMGPRLHVNGTTLELGGEDFALEEGPSRHVQVLRMQPGDPLRLFDGAGGEWQAEVTEMGRKVVRVRVTQRIETNRELPVRVTLAVGLMANDRMDALVEKATELGVHAIQPLVCTRSVLRLDGERAVKKVAHWQGVAIAASEQCGRAVVPQVRPVLTSLAWLKPPAQHVDTRAAPMLANPSLDGSADLWRVRGVLSLRDAQPVGAWLEGLVRARDHSATPGPDGLGPQDGADWCFFSGPEGGLTPEEEDLALASGWQAVSLGRRVLRADTAPLAVLSVIGAAMER